MNAAAAPLTSLTGQLRPCRRAGPPKRQSSLHQYVTFVHLATLLQIDPEHSSDPGLLEDPIWLGR